MTARRWHLTVILTLATAAFVVGLTPAIDARQKKTDVEEIEALVTEYTRLEDAGDMMAQAKLIAPDRWWHGIGGRRTENDLWMKVQAEGFAASRKRYPGLQTIREVRDLEVRMVAPNVAVASFTWFPNRVIPPDLPTPGTRARWRQRCARGAGQPLPGSVAPMGVGPAARMGPRPARQRRSGPGNVRRHAPSPRRLRGSQERGSPCLSAGIIGNRIRDEIRRMARRPVVQAADEGLEDRSPSPLEAAIGAEALGRYERALAVLSHTDRDAVIARVEFGLGYAEIAAALGKTSPDAARMTVSRALLHLAQEMGRA